MHFQLSKNMQVHRRIPRPALSHSPHTLDLFAEVGVSIPVTYFMMINQPVNVRDGNLCQSHTH